MIDQLLIAGTAAACLGATAAFTTRIYIMRGEFYVNGVAHVTLQRRWLCGLFYRDELTFRRDGDEAFRHPGLWWNVTQDKPVARHLYQWLDAYIRIQGADNE